MARPSMRDILGAMRPNQWTKNTIVVAAFFFASWDTLRSHHMPPLQLLNLLPLVIGATALFCMASSGVYIINDIRDATSDRHHPFKKHRPIAAGRIPLPWAWLEAAILICASLIVAFFLNRPFAVVLSTYLLLQSFYTFWLKRIALVDVIVIACGFVLRAIAGAVLVTGAAISPWLLLCTFLLALFLGLCKRRQEKAALADGTTAQRESLGNYDLKLLDQLIAITSSATIVCYAIYTVWPETVEKFGTSALGFTIPLVIFGIFRYLDLAYRHGKAERPERVLLTDTPMLVTLALYAISILLIFSLTRPT